MVATAHAIINDDRHDNGTTVVFAVSILPVATPRARSYVLEPMPRIRFNDATPTIGRGAAEAALFRESVERMDRP
jgi:hypothetical protein